jgi:hypothetical protein
VEPDGDCAFGIGRTFEAAKKFGTDAKLSEFWKNFDGGDIRDDNAGLPSPFDNGKPSHVSILLSDPGGGTGRGDELTHVAASKAVRRLEADFFDGVEVWEVSGLEEAVMHHGQWLVVSAQ